MCFLYVIGTSCDVVITRKINKIHFAVLVFWISGLLTIIYAVLLVYDYSIADEIRLINYSFDPYWKLLLILGFASSTRILCSTLAFQLEKSIIMTSIQQVNIVYAFMADLIMFNVKFNKYQYFGAGLVIVTNFIAVMVNLLKKDKSREKKGKKLL